jgi:hypothetical protein
MREARVRVRLRFWVETGFASVSGCIAVALARFPDWIEVVFGRDPDSGSGSLEELIAIGLSVVAVMLFAMAGLEWFRATGAASEARLRRVAPDDSA